MDVQVAVLCDAAADCNGKLIVHGTFDTIVTSQLPIVHPSCSVALRMLFNKVEEGKHEIKLHFGDEDGKPVMQTPPLPMEVMVPDDSIFVSRNLIINIQQLKFDKAGLYSIDFALDGRQAGSIPLLVKLVTPQRPQQLHP